MKKPLILIISAVLLLTGCADKGEEELLPVPVTEESPEAKESEVTVEIGIPENIEETTESTEETTEIPDETPSSEGTEELKEAVNSFNWKLYETLPEDENIFYSPFSLESAIALSGLAAKGDTADGIYKALSIKEPEGFKAAMKEFITKKQPETSYLRTANGLFISESLELSPGYAEDFEAPAKEYYGGEFKMVDFKDTASVKDEIKSFVDKNTEGMISNYESPVNEATVADILNAVYFYGEWQNKFEADDTFEDTFHTTEKDVKTDMMHMGKRYFRYVSEIDGIKAVALPYDGSTYEMDLFMYSDPDKKDVKGLFNGTDPEKVLETLDKAEEISLNSLVIPKFKMDLDIKGLKEKLSTLGMEKVFSDEADLSLLAKDLKISDICHRAVLEVDEEGSRAAAVTEVIMELTSSLPFEEEINEFIADRPFIFVIRDKESGIILFTGRFIKPE